MKIIVFLVLLLFNVNGSYAIKYELFYNQEKKFISTQDYLESRFYESASGLAYYWGVFFPNLILNNIKNHDENSKGKYFLFNKFDENEVLEILLENIIEFYNKSYEYKSNFYIFNLNSVLNIVVRGDCFFSGNENNGKNLNILLKDKFKENNKFDDFSKFDNWISSDKETNVMNYDGGNSSREEIRFYFYIIEKMFKIYLDKFSETYVNSSDSDKSLFIEDFSRTLILYWIGVKVGCMERDVEFENNMHSLVSNEIIKKDVFDFIYYMKKGNFFRTKIKNGLNMEMYPIPDIFEREDKWNELFDSFCDWLIKGKNCLNND